MRLKGTTRGGWRGKPGRKKRRRDEEEEEEERGVSGQPGSSRATRRKPRYHPLSTPRSSHPNDPATLPPSLPASPQLPVRPPARRSSSSSSHAYPPRRALSKPLPRFHLRFLLAARVARGCWVVNHPRATFGSHARTTETTASDDISARWRGRVYDGRRINSADGSMRRRFFSLSPSSFPLFFRLPLRRRRIS